MRYYGSARQSEVRDENPRRDEHQNPLSNPPSETGAAKTSGECQSRILRPLAGRVKRILASANGVSRVDTSRPRLQPAPAWECANRGSASTPRTVYPQLPFDHLIIVRR